MLQLEACVLFMLSRIIAASPSSESRTFLLNQAVEVHVLWLATSRQWKHWSAKCSASHAYSYTEQ